jgi:hypothetical protein
MLCCAAVAVTPLATDPALAIGGYTEGVLPGFSDGPSKPEYFSITYDGNGNRLWRQQVRTMDIISMALLQL